MVKLVGAGSVIHRATPSVFFLYCLPYVTECGKNHKLLTMLQVSPKLKLHCSVPIYSLAAVHLSHWQAHIAEEALPKNNFFIKGKDLK